MKPILFISSFFFPAILLAGCSGLLVPSPDPANLYVLQKASPVSIPSRPITQTSLLISLPLAYPPLDTRRIAIMVGPNQIDYLSHMEWSQRLPVMVQESLIQSFQDLGCFELLLRSPLNFSPLPQLNLEIRQFQVSPSQTGYEALGEYFVTLRIPGKRALQTTFKESEPFPNLKKQEITTSLNTVNQTLLTSIMEWTLSKL